MARIRIRNAHPIGQKSRELSNQIEKLQEELDSKDRKRTKPEISAEITKLQTQREPLLEQLNKLDTQFTKQAEEAVQKTKVVFLSATPFKSVFNLRYANGVLFDWGNNERLVPKSQGMSRVNPEGQFFLDNFGSQFEWKNNQLQTKSKVNPEAVAMQEIAFNAKLNEAGVMSGRAIESDMDYRRDFPILTGEKSD
jgi:hypothetical protein